MQVDHLYYKESVREGFFIPGFMKRFWAAQIEVLERVDEVCKKHDIKWFASDGTLLGAVRHKGFIPWDDDIDICMLRKDYDRFLEIAPLEMKDMLFKTNFIEQGNLCFCTRVYNSEKVSLDGEVLNKYHGCPLSVGIDVFVLDNISDNNALESERNQKIYEYNTMLASALKNGESEEKAYAILGEIEKYVKQFANENTKYVASILERLDNPKMKASERIWFDETVSLPFENTRVNAPLHYDRYLTALFGDYMKVVKGGGEHQYPAYERNEEIFIKALEGKSPFEYNVEEGLFHSDKQIIFEKLLELINHFYERLVHIRESISGSSETDASDKTFDKNSILKMLIEAQNTAVSIGEGIEKILGEGTNIVLMLERCCEAIYRLFINIQADSNLPANNVETDGNLPANSIQADSNLPANSIQTDSDLLANSIQTDSNLPANSIQTDSDLLANSIQTDGYLSSAIGSFNESLAELHDYINDRKDRKEVLIVAAFAEDYERVVKLRDNLLDEGKRVSVLLVPYHIRYMNGALGEQYIEKEKYSDINVCTCDEYNIKAIHPDCIYTFYGYDETNQTMVIDINYFCSALRECTRELVYIQPFTVDEINDDDNKMLKMLPHYADIPAMIYANRIIVQSKQLKDRYIQCFTMRHGHKYKALLEDKISTSLLADK